MKFLLLRKPWLATTSSSISALTFIGVLSFLSSQWESASGAVLFVTSKIPFLDMPYEMDETELFIALPVVGFVWGMYIFGILPVKVGGKNLLTSLVTDRLQESGNNSNATEPTCEALTVLDLLRCRFNTTAAADGEKNLTSVMNPEESLRYDLLTEIANTLVKLDDNQIEDTLGSGRSSSPLLDGDTNEPDGQWVIGRTIKALLTSDWKSCLGEIACEVENASRRYTDASNVIDTSSPHFAASRDDADAIGGGGGAGGGIFRPRDCSGEYKACAFNFRSVARSFFSHKR